MESKKRKIFTIQTFRAIIQIISFVFLAGLFTVTFGSIKSIYLAVLDQSFTVEGYLAQLLLLAGSILLTALTGRFFCGWMCSFGALMDFLHFLSAKIIKKPIRVNATLDKILKGVKYLVLAFSVVVIWTLGNSLFAQDNPWNVFGMAVSFSNLTALPTFIAEMKIGAVLLGLIIIGGFFIERFFCRYLCPLGALFAVFSKPRLFKIRKQEGGCGKCMGCSKTCSMGINLNAVETVNSGECINCLKCLDGCHRGNMTFAAAGKPMKRVVASLVAVIVILTTGAAYEASSYIDYQAASNITLSTISSNTAQTTQPSGQTTDLSSQSTDQSTPTTDQSSQSTDQPAQTTSQSNQTTNQSGQTTNPSTQIADQTTTSSQATQQTGNFTDGVYEGTGSGFKGTTTLRVTVSGGYITNIETISTGDDRPYYNRAFSSVAGQIVNAQNASVDAVSGATFSSNGIMEAVANAIGQDFQNTNAQRGPGR